MPKSKSEALLLLMALCLSSCSIKEDRTGCPCILDVSLSGGDERLAEVSVWNDVSEVQAKQVDLHGDSLHFELSVPREHLTFCARSGQHFCTMDGPVLRIPTGCEMDELYACGVSVDAFGEVAALKARLHRQHAFVHIRVINVRPEEFPYKFRIRGGVAGIDLRTLEPVDGEFETVVEPVMGGYRRFCLPRQNGGRLYLDLLDDNMEVLDSGRAVYDIGSIIESGGYDWTADDLDDIQLDVDFVNAELSVRIMNWETIEL